MAIKQKIFIAIAFCLMALSATAQTMTTMTNHSEKVAAILKAVELYAEAGRSASREI
jgi:hypothetical protein